MATPTLSFVLIEGSEESAALEKKPGLHALRPKALADFLSRLSLRASFSKKEIPSGFLRESPGMSCLGVARDFGRMFQDLFAFLSILHETLGLLRDCLGFHRGSFGLP